MRRRLALLAGFVLALAAVLVLAERGDPVPRGVPTVPALPGVGDGRAALRVADPFAWAPGRGQELVRRAAAGTSHPLYVFSPGGAAASAARTARWRRRVERTAAAAQVDPDLLEGLVMLESAGREDARTGAGTEGAVGLAQILAATGRDFLGLRVDVAASRRLTRRIEREARRGRLDRVARLRRARRVVDERYDGAKALAAAGRYLVEAKARFGRRGPRRRLLPHGHGQSRGGAARLRARRLHPDPPARGR